MPLVVDASVVVKWLLDDAEREADTDRATLLMQYVLAGSEPIVQPAHWLLEVGAVLARLSPQSAEEDLLVLQALQLQIDDGPEVLLRACRLAIDLDQHLFDTLYHAVALETAETTLITADERYFAVGAPLGRITRLADWQAPA